MLTCRYNVPFLRQYASFAPEVVESLPAKKFQFCQSTEYFVAALEDHKDTFGKCETGHCVLFEQQQISPLNFHMSARRKIDIKSFFPPVFYNDSSFYLKYDSIKGFKT